MQTKKQEYICDEESFRITSPSKFWNVQYEWVEAMIRFYRGDNLSMICNDLQVFEGNMMRTISRCNNILEELRSLATFQNDVSLLKKIENVAPKISCEGLAQDSLYLHL
jgi:superfamily II RNA helicase